MTELQRRVEDIGVNLTKKTKVEPVKPNERQAIPEGVKKIGDFGVLFEEKKREEPESRPLSPAEGRRRTW
jgi:hypothetical protein